MRFSTARFVNALVVAGLGALGGALIVFSEFDDAPGGVLIGILLIVVAVTIGSRSRRSDRGGQPGT